MPFDDPLPPAHYLVMVCKAGERPRSNVWPISVRQSLPTIPIPLLPPDPPVPLELGPALRTAYERARYDLRVDYRQPPVPPLSSADAAWAEALTGSPGTAAGRRPRESPAPARPMAQGRPTPRPVSYTHLTLPTIYSV